MSSVPQTPAHYEVDPEQRDRSLLLAQRLMFFANISIQLSFLFAYLYLRANNYDGGWNPNPDSPAPMAGWIAVLVTQVVAVAAVWAAALPARRGDTRVRVNALIIALVASLVGIGVRVFQLTHTNWEPSDGTYVDVSVLWMAVVAAEVTVGAAWLLRLVMGQVRRTVAATTADLRAVSEYWLAVSVITLGVFLLVQFVT
jgi:hypothetical protein